MRKWLFIYYSFVEISRIYIIHLKVSTSIASSPRTEIDSDRVYSQVAYQSVITVIRNLGAASIRPRDKRIQKSSKAPRHEMRASIKTVTCLAIL